MAIKLVDTPVLAGVYKRDYQRFLFHQKVKESKATLNENHIAK
jgi:hypothetical protein